MVDGGRSTPTSEQTWNVPTSLTPLIGRDQDVARACRLLMLPEVRELTLVGTGGIGKTLLGLQIAMEMRANFSDGVCFVPLAPISDSGLVVPTIAHTLGLRETGGLPLLEHLHAYLNEKRLLLLLDNFEQVVTAAPQVEELLAASPQIKIMVTSREVLHLQAEQVYPVPPLALPDLTMLPESEDLSEYAAVALFVRRAQSILPTFQATPANTRVIAEICVRLDGLPLAIELASARVRLLPPQALLARLSAHQLVILTGGARTLPERQQTLRNTLQWSYNLLSVEEQGLFRRLSVFDEGWTLEAMEAVCTVETEHRTLSVPSALDGVASLLDKSLLQRVEQESGEEQEPRFRMLVTVGEYGRVCLRESGEAEIIQRNHAAYFLALAERAEPLLKGAQQLTWLLRLEQERANLRAALTWFMERDEAEQALRLSGALWYFWYLQGDWSEGRRWLEAVLGLPSAQGSTGERAKALFSAGELAYWQVDYSTARRLLEESIALYRALGDDRGLASPLGRLGLLLQLQGDLAAGGHLAEESITLCRIHGNTWALCTLLSQLGWAATLKGDYTKAGAILQECLTLARELGDQSLIAEALIVNGFLTFLQDESTQAAILLQEGLRLARELGHKVYIASALVLLGFIALSLHDYSQATALFTEGFSLGKELGDKLILVWNLTGLALVAAAANEPHRAAQLFGVVEVLVEPHNRLLPPSGRAIYEKTVATVRTQLGEEVFAKAMAEGRLMTPEQALAAKEPAPIQSGAPSAPSHMREAAKQALGGLTEREREVARLVAEGKANREIAEVLVVNYRTVEKHIENILSKLGFTSRAQIAVWAADKGLREKEQNSR